MTATLVLDNAYASTVARIVLRVAETAQPDVFLSLSDA